MEHIDDKYFNLQKDYIQFLETLLGECEQMEDYHPEMIIDSIITLIDQKTTELQSAFIRH